MAQFTFNATEIPADQRPDPIPAGDYLMQVIASEINRTKGDTGDMLTLTCQVLEGEYENRLIWDRLNVVNQNPEAERISKRALADLCEAVGVFNFNDTEQVHFKPFIGRVGIKTDKNNQYPPQNTVRYKSRNGQAPAPQAQPSAPPPQQPRSAPQAQAAAQPRTWQRPRV